MSSKRPGRFQLERNHAGAVDFLTGFSREKDSGIKPPRGVCVSDLTAKSGMVPLPEFSDFRTLA